MDIILDTKKTVLDAIKNILDTLCFTLFDCNFENLNKNTKFKDTKFPIIKIFLSKYFSIDYIHNYPELEYWFKQLRNIINIAKNEGFDIILIIN
jgi:hypothetical protein